MKIVSRSQWGARRDPTTPRPLSRLGWFLCHYHGGPPPAATGTWVPKNIEAIHLANGWQGVGYHFMVDQAGTIYEGRGWDYVGAHSPPHNTDGLGVYVAIGGDQKPTDAALRSVRWLYDEACRKTGRTLRKSWHGYDYATACPGPHLIAWVKGGMKVTGTPTTEKKKDWFDMASKADLEKIVKDNVGERGLRWTDRVTLTDITAESIGWGKRKTKTMSLGGLLQTTMRITAENARGIRHTKAELAKIADDVEALQ